MSFSSLLVISFSLYDLYSCVKCVFFLPRVFVVDMVLFQTYLLKLASPGQEKAVLLLESGVRFHTTK